MTETRVRTSARVVLLDEHDRVLMLKVRDDSIVVPGWPVPEEFWILVGGGVELGESWEEAAQRELFEETGLGEVELGPCVWKADVDIVWSGEPVRAIEHYFVGRVENAQISIDNPDAAERISYRTHRWWSVEEMQDAEGRECFRPPGLPELFQQLLEGAPDRPVTLTY